MGVVSRADTAINTNRPRSSHRGSLLDVSNPVAEIQEAVRQYFAPDAGRIEDVFCEPNSKGLFIGLKCIDGADERHLLTTLNGTSASESDVFTGSGSAGRLYSLNELLNLTIHKPQPVIEDLLYEGE